MKKLLLLAAIFAAFVTAGCGGGGGSDAVTTDLLVNGQGTTGGTTGGTGGTTTLDVGSVTLTSLSKTLVASGSNLVNPSSSTGLLRITVKDTAGQPYANELVTFSYTGGNITGNFTTNSLGEVDAFFTAPSTLGPVTITAAAGLIRSNDVTIDIVVGPPSSIDLYPNPTVVGPIGTSEITAIVSDGNGYPVKTKVLGQITDNQSAATVPFLGYIDTDANGVAKLTYAAGGTASTYNSATPVTDTITAFAGNYNSATTIDVVQASASLKSFTMASTRNIITADDGDFTKVFVTAIDTNNNGVPGIVVNFATTLGGLSTTSNGTKVATQKITTNASGVAEVFLIAGKQVGQAKVTAKTDSGNFGVVFVTLEAGPVATISLNGFPNPVAPAGSATLTAIATDQYNSPVVNTPITFLLSASDLGKISPNPVNTDVNGRAVTTYTAGLTAGTYDINARADNAVTTSNALSMTVVANQLVGAMTAEVDQQLLPNDGATAATVTVTTVDDQGAPLPGVLITASTTGSAKIIHADPSNTITDANGVYQFTVTDTAAENVTLTVSVGEKQQSFILYFGATLSLVPSTSNAVGSTVLSALLKDADNAPIAGVPVSFAFASTYADKTLNPIDPATRSDGTARVNVVDLSGTGGSVTVSAESGAVTTDSAATVKFQADGNGFFLDARATVSTLDTGESSTITATLTDAQGLPVEGITVNFTHTGNAVLGTDTGKSNASGQVSTTVTDAVAETVIITVQAGTAVIDVPLYFGAKLSLNPPTTVGLADGVTPVILTATVSDAFGAAVAGVPVDFAVTGGDALLDAGQVITDAAGKASVRVTDTQQDAPAKVEATAGLIAPETSSITFEPGEPANLAIATTSTDVSLGGSATITVTVTDSLGNAVKLSTPVTFTLTGPGSVTTSAATDSQGQAKATFSAGGVSGTSTITATSGSVSNFVNITVKPASAGSIELVSVDPAFIHIQGTQGQKFSTIKFKVIDGLGNPVEDGTSIDLALDSTTVGGGEAISTGGPYAATTTGTTSNGIVTVTLRSGTVAGTVDVVATANTGTPEEVSTTARVAILGGQPDAKHISLAAAPLNLAGGLYNGLQSTITAYLGDRFGNVVIDGTPVSFISECGTIGTSGGFETTTQLGVAQAILQTSSPTVPDLDGGSASANPGWCRIVAYTTGSETWADNNGNGIFDTGDTCIGDRSEPYIDDNDNGSYDANELYIDVDGNGVFTAADGTCTDNTVIWSSMNVLMSDEVSPINLKKNPPDPLNLTDTSFALGIGESQSFVFDFMDIWKNALVAGTTLNVTATGGTLSGTTSLNQADTIGPGGTYGFTLHSDLEASAKPKIVEVTVTIGSAPGANNNGATVFTSAVGSINLPPPTPAPQVVLTDPTDGQTGVATSSKVTIVFNNVMNGFTVTPTNITMVDGGSPHALVGDTNIKNQNAYTFTPGPQLLPGTTYTVTVSTGVLDENGNPPAAPYVFSFTTAP